VTAVEGDSSRIFWWRRWIEHSRSPRLIGEDLDLDVAWFADVLLQVDGCVTERGASRVGCALDRGDQLGLLLHDLHADPAAAAGRLDDHRQPDLEGGPASHLQVLDRVGAGRRRHAVSLRQLPRRQLVAEKLHRLRRRTDEGDPGRLAGLGKREPLAEEAVAGMDGLRAGVLGGLHDPLQVQVRLRRRGSSDVDRLAGVTSVDRVPVRVRVDRHGADVQLVAGTHDADRYLAPVGDQYLAKELALHRR